jgi:HD-GYP domain-containing protein (c-di-GMP phosphodiesterase class II)
MTSERPYQSAMNPAQARHELMRCAGTQFDGLVVHVFVRALARLAEGDQLSFGRRAERAAS